MIKITNAGDRGHADHGWLKTWHSFSFGSWHDANHMKFRTLRVMNEDIIAAGQGFGTHPHRDMEIVTYVLSGQLEHRDSMGNGEVLRPGEFQRMSAGSGITHSEFNPSGEEPVHLYQIWLYPESRGIAPSYEQRPFDASGRLDRFQLVASPDGACDSLLIHQDARIFLTDVSDGTRIEYAPESDRHVWLQVLRGSLTLNELPLAAGDGAAVSEERLLELQGGDAAEIMLFDLA